MPDEFLFTENMVLSSHLFYKMVRKTQLLSNILLVVLSCLSAVRVITLEGVRKVEYLCPLFEPKSVGS